MLTPTAAATLTEPSLVSAFGRFSVVRAVFDSFVVLSVSFVPSAVFFSVALVTCSPTLSSTVFFSPAGFVLSFGSSSASVFPPAAPAMATVSEAPALSAMKLTPLPAAIFRAVVASAWSVATVTAMPAPIAAFSPSAWPLAVVLLLPVLSALTLRSPVMSKVSPMPILAFAWLSAMVIATTGVTAVPPAAPASASVRRLWEPTASRLTLLAPVRIVPSAISATAWLTPIFKAKEAPTPTLLPSAIVPSCGTAFTVLSLLLDAVIVTISALISPALPILAAVSFRWTLTANAPATPTLAAPAPEVTFVVNLFVASAPFINASTVNLLASTA